MPAGLGGVGGRLAAWAAASRGDKLVGVAPPRLKGWGVIKLGGVGDLLGATAAVELPSPGLVGT